MDADRPLCCSFVYGSFRDQSLPRRLCKRYGNYNIDGKMYCGKHIHFGPIMGKIENDFTEQIENLLKISSKLPNQQKPLRELAETLANADKNIPQKKINVANRFIEICKKLLQ